MLACCGCACCDQSESGRNGKIESQSRAWHRSFALSSADQIHYKTTLYRASFSHAKCMLFTKKRSCKIVSTDALGPQTLPARPADIGEGVNNNVLSKNHKLNLQCVPVHSRASFSHAKCMPKLITRQTRGHRERCKAYKQQRTIKE